jgi:hypothetical protein
MVFPSQMDELQAHNTVREKAVMPAEKEPSRISKALDGYVILH